MVDPTTPLATSTRVPSSVLSEDVSTQNMGTSDAPDRRGQQAPTSYERRLGDTEVSYYLQGRATGVNDMFAPSIASFRRTMLAYTE